MKQPKQRTLIYQGQAYPYDLYLGGVKRINLRVRPDGSIRVSAPRLTSQCRIDAFLTQYGDKIATAVLRAKQRTLFDPPQISAVEQARRKQELLAIIRECHQNVVLPRFASLPLALNEQQKSYIQSPTAIRIRAMKSRWGSCNFSKGTLNFNFFLLDQPLECIEYVVMHEFAHFVYPNHSPTYHALMTALMPDWKERKARLNS